MIDNTDINLSELMLTTIDNPFNPFTEFDAWYNYDVQQGYNTCAYMARVAASSDELSDEDETKELNRVAKEIIDFNITGNYILVDKDLIRYII